MKRSRFQVRVHLCRIGVAAVLMYGGAAAAGGLSVCIDKASPSAAVEQQLARAVARQEGNTLSVHTFDSDEGGDDGFSPKEFSKLARQSCDLVLGFPVDADEGSVPSGLQATTPYGHTGFVLVTARRSKATTLDSLPGNSRVAVTYLTTPNLYFADHPKLQADVHPNDRDALKALRAGAVNAAMLWQPSVVRYLSERDEADSFSYHELREPHAQFDLVALYDHDHAEAAAAFERAITALTASGELAKVLKPYAETGGAQLSPRRPSASLWRSRRTRRMDRRCATDSKSQSDDGAAPALFTKAQAESGKQKFLENCAQCHGPTLAGRAGPALKGPNFASAKAKFHVSDIFTIVSQNMPATEPGSLPHQDYVEIMAFLLQQNGYPDGSTQLTFEQAKESKVKLIYRGD
ncbi:MAG: transporter substrate-binding domain-containing protein [Rhodanobacter sp.]